MSTKNATIRSRLYNNNSTGDFQSTIYKRRWNSSNAKSKEEEYDDDLDDDEEEEEEDDKGLLYKGPFAKLTLKLKRVSLTTAFMGLFGVPLLAVLKSGGDVSAIGKVAVGGVAVLAATGSTLALSFCFSPYIHTLEVMPSSSKEEELLKATTRNILGVTVETIFDPNKDVVPYKGNRPFCNFLANDKSLYVHPELIHDQKLYAQLFGETKEQQEETERKHQQSQDDEFF
eukprot:CAMPEP_0197828064 /NCGR_PEP_ID=MMETSP1437-20131217/4708_1 /TAXON_ID=49252 ORGANISM="Eucampia antarctica, Strain CCMP1452" /NCGR_SAMPLE_ID=MMETSP1437 /ASSEMBLY_ACC=CAM_ASM_001096 /LENGTH=228 /DNA_ID=CAMNT_0043429145 /DNA_START=187 /DNA_END=873 /DNA_ORIENTATION=+